MIMIVLCCLLSLLCSVCVCVSFGRIATSAFFAHFYTAHQVQICELKFNNNDQRQQIKIIIPIHICSFHKLFAIGTGSLIYVQNVIMYNQNEQCKRTHNFHSQMQHIQPTSTKQTTDADSIEANKNQ